MSDIGLRGPKTSVRTDASAKYLQLVSKDQPLQFRDGGNIVSYRDLRPPGLTLVMGNWMPHKFNAEAGNKTENTAKTLN